MLKQRVITGIILAVIVIGGIFVLDSRQFAWFIAVIIGLGAWEWANLSGFPSQPARFAYVALVEVLLWLVAAVSTQNILLLAVLWWVGATALVLSYPRSSSLWKSQFVRLLMGILILVPLWKALVALRTVSIQGHPEWSNLWLILYAMALVWVADIGAYFAGRAWGKNKLAPKVSPGKSWEGAWGGLAAIAVFAAIVTLILEESIGFGMALVICSLFAGMVSVIGDLAESMFKRTRGIKDSSQLLPGHGGVMDRIDSLTAAVPVFTFLLLLSGWIA